MSLVRGWMPRRAADAHKGDCGRVYVLAGSKDMVGAGVLVSLGAVQTGAGLVRLGTVRGRQAVAARRVPLEVTTEGFSEDKNGFLSGGAWRRISSSVERFQTDVLAIGPGLGQSAGVRKLALNFLTKSAVPIVLDADGLNVMKGKLAPRPDGRAYVITPHTGELSRLLGWSAKKILQNRSLAALTAARRFGCVCLLKGPGTLVSDGTRVYQNTTGNPAMASGGMGDLLTGVIASLWGQMPLQNKENGFRAAVTGAFVHGLAADRAVKSLRVRVLAASKTAEFLPKVL